MRRAAILSAALFAACMEAPAYEGRLCDREDPCPHGLTCTEAGVCEADPEVTPGEPTTPADPSIALVSSRNKHVLALRSDGTVLAWGWNEHAQVAGGPLDAPMAPTPLALDDVVHVEAGGVMSFAVRANGSVWAWGANGSGELGLGEPSAPVAEPVSVTRLGPDVVELSAGYSFTLVLGQDGTVRSFGTNNRGQLGDGSQAMRFAPGEVTGLAGIVAVAAGAYHGVALDDRGDVWTWGANGHGQLGNGTTGGEQLVPQRVAGAGNIVQIAAGWGHTLALRRDGTVLAFGWNRDGQLGDGTTMTRAYPGPVRDAETGAPIEGITAIAAGFNYSVLSRGDGRLLSVGMNTFGQLGHGTTSNAVLPGPVRHSSGALLEDVERFEAGADHVVVLTRGGELWTWGRNDYGELGVGPREAATAPLHVEMQ